MKTVKYLIACGLLATGSLWASPIYYLFDGDSSSGKIVDVSAGTVTNFQTFQLGYPVAIVGGTIRLHDRRDASSVGGVEYDLSGVPTGNVFAGNDTVGIDQMLDGTSDGTFNYAVQCCGSTNRVWRSSLTWQGFAPLFVLPNEGSGITYDPVSGTLFILFFDGTLNQYSLSGTLLDSWSLGDFHSALAYDWQTDSLFAYNRVSGGISQISKTGVILNTFTVPGLSGNIFGGEIAPRDDGAIPEPGTAGLLALGLAGAAWAHRRRK